MRIKRPVTVKLILTPATRAQLLQQYEQSMRQLALELDQLDFERRKLLHRAEKQGREAYQKAETRLDEEEARRRKKHDQLKEQYDQIEKLEEGTEMVHGQVESEVAIEVGDDWEALTNTPEIVLKDGKVFEIRGGKK